MTWFLKALRSSCWPLSFMLGFDSMFFFLCPKLVLELKAKHLSDLNAYSNVDRYCNISMLKIFMLKSWIPSVLDLVLRAD